ncbi:uncharacterized protein TNCV_5033271 [Trichonephila clavipes]|nr:uncharacterized protein TNCV_5033271 [Trichonephila clavipes]
MVKPTVFRGKNAIDQFLTKLLDEEKSILDILRFVKPMVFSMTDEENFKSSTLCSICENPLNGDAVRDNDHLTGAYRGAAHNRCNLNFKLANYIPVVIHNLRNYDGHFLIQGIGKFKEKRIQCIPENSEKFISFTLSSLRFIDSFQFLNTSLEKLAQNLKPCQFHLCNKYFASNAQFITRKGCYPYEYFDSFSKFYETQLPPQSAFFNSLTNENVSREDYEYAHHIWNIFQMHTLGDYHDLYVTVDVLLLSDIFENFRTLCQNYYKIDPCHTYTAPGLAWQACLKMTKVRLELLTDIDMHLFIEKGIRGGVAIISQSLSKFNDGYRYLLTCICVLSKYAWAIPLHDKNVKTVVSAFEQIFSERVPLKLQTDAEKNTKRYIDVVDKLVYSYNNTWHRSIQMTPASVTETNQSQVSENLYGKQNNKKVNKPNYRLNDTVRISKEKLLFEKGYEQNWTREIFTIHEIIRRNPIVYKLKDFAGEVIRGTFYEQELQKVMHSGYYPVENFLKTREKNGKKEYFVKLLGYPEKFNTWVQDLKHL